MEEMNKISLEEFKKICNLLENAIEDEDSLEAKIIRLLDEGK